jgi:hypothetical protein
LSLPSRQAPQANPRPQRVPGFAVEVDAGRLPASGHGQTVGVTPSAIGPVALQGAYYVVTGAWAVVDRRSFESVSGAKTDYWLVRTVGLLAVAIGTALLISARRDQGSAGSVALAVGAGASFTAIDVTYVARRSISPIYLVDALTHAGIAALALTRRRRQRRRRIGT